MPSSPKNYHPSTTVPKPVGIIILFVFFLPILTVGGTYSVASTEMMSELGIISEHIQFANFATSIGMAAFCLFCIAGSHTPAENDVPGRILPDVHLQLYLCQDRQRFPAGTMQHLYGIPTNGADDGQPLHPHKYAGISRRTTKLHPATSHN